MRRAIDFISALTQDLALFLVIMCALLFALMMAQAML